MARRHSLDSESAIKELTRGYELAKKLQAQLELSGGHEDNGWIELATGLSSGVLQTFTSALSLIKSNRTEDRNQRVPKRRREMNSCSEVTPDPYLDGYQWRKYGQKKIHNAKHPRTYYRCTYSRDQKCPATKQVQQQDQYGESVPMFLVIYNNCHTCITTELSPTRIILDSPAEQHECSFWVLGSNKSNPKFINAAEEEKLLSPRHDNSYTTTLDVTNYLGTTEMAHEVPTESSVPDMDGCLYTNPFHILDSYGCEFDEL